MMFGMYSWGEVVILVAAIMFAVLLFCVIGFMMQALYSTSLWDCLQYEEVSVVWIEGGKEVFQSELVCKIWNKE